MSTKKKEPTYKVVELSNNEILEVALPPDNVRVTNGDIPKGQCLEIQEGEAQTTDVQGRLKQKLVFWHETLQASSIVLQWIQTGYKLPLQYLPDPTAKVITHQLYPTTPLLWKLSHSCW